MKRKTFCFLAGAAAAALAAGGAALLLGGRQERQNAEYEVSGEAFAESGTAVSYQGKDYRYREALRNYLFLGIDSYSQEEGAGQADAIFLLSWDTGNQTMQALKIPRDTMTEIEVFSHGGEFLGTTRDHINLQYAYGDGRGSSCRLMKEAVSNLLYQLPVDGCCALQMDGITVLNNAVGGTTVTISEEGLSGFTAGSTVTLQGDQAEAFVRYRDIKENQSALQRMDRQQIFLDAWIARAKELAASDPGFAAKLYTQLEPYMVTDMSNDIFARLLAAGETGEESVQTLPGTPHTGEQFDEYQVDEAALYELILTMYYEEVDQE